MSISLDIQAGADGRDGAIAAGGQDEHVITDAEQRSLGLGEAVLKSAIEEHLGRRPNDVFLHSPTPWGDLYQTYGWPEVKVTVATVHTEVAGIEKLPTVAAYTNFINHDNFRTKVGGDVSATIFHNVATRWHDSRTEGSTVKIGASFKVLGLGGDLSVDFKSEHTFGKDDTTTAGDSHTYADKVERELDPGGSFEARITVTRWELKGRVRYRVSLSGAVAVNYDVPQAGHHFHAVDIATVMAKAGLQSSFEITSDVTIGYFTEGHVEILPSRKPAPSGIVSLAAARNADGRLEVFALAEKKVWNLWQTAPGAGPWGGWGVLEGARLKAIAPVRNADGRAEIFGVGNDARVWHVWQQAPNAGPWSEWDPLGGGVTAVAPILGADGRLEVFAIGADGALLHNWQMSPGAGPWSGWQSLHGGVKRIAPVLNTDGRLEVFALGADGVTYHIWQWNPHAGPWSDWEPLGGWSSEIAPIVNADGRVEVFAIGAGGALHNIWQMNPHAGPWSEWTWQGGVVSQIVPQLNTDGRVEVFAVGADRAVHHLWQTAPGAGPWSEWESFGGTARVIATAINADGRAEIFAVDDQGTIQHTWQTSPHAGPWNAWAPLG